MKVAPIRHRLEFGAYLAAKAAILALPHPRVRRAGRGLGAVAWTLLAGARRRTLRQLEIGLPELSAEERRRVARASFLHFGSAFCEVVSLERYSREDAAGLVDVEGWETLAELEAAGRRYFLTTGHFGCWELAAVAVAARTGDLDLVVRPPDNPWVDRDVRRSRERLAGRLILKAGAGHRMLNAHRRGGRVAVLIDQHVRPSAGIRVPFFGRPAWTSPVLAFLSLHTGSPVVYLSCVPAPGGRYRATIHPPIEPDGAGAGEEAQAALTRRYLEDVEADVRRRPDLYLWMHRRWRD